MFEVSGVDCTAKIVENLSTWCHAIKFISIFFSVVQYGNEHNASQFTVACLCCLLSLANLKSAHCPSGQCADLYRLILMSSIHTHATQNPFFA